ncbi:MAG: GIY-YIG nuclease family protein, partial [bacterium]|nr:GIY-YIG nuclease family protein [bacterium]
MTIYWKVIVMVYIYTLACADAPNEIRYVGKTSESLTRRLGRHTSSYYLNEGTYKSRWISKAIQEGREIVIKELDVVSDNGWQRWEKYWIEQLGQWGFQLVNTTAGGDGVELTPELIEQRNESNRARGRDRLESRIRKYNIREKGGNWV